MTKTELAALLATPITETEVQEAYAALTSNLAVNGVQGQSVSNTVSVGALLVLVHRLGTALTS